MYVCLSLCIYIRVHIDSLSPLWLIPDLPRDQSCRSSRTDFRFRVDLALFYCSSQLEVLLKIMSFLFVSPCLAFVLFLVLVESVGALDERDHADEQICFVVCFSFGEQC